MTRITLTNDELITVRDAMRGLNTHLDALETGEQKKLVLTRHNQMLGVVLSLERYALYEDIIATVHVMLESDGNDLRTYNDASGELSELLGQL